MSELKAEQWLDYAGEPRPCYPKSEADRVIAHSNYKRCLAMAYVEWLKQMALCNYPESILYRMAAKREHKWKKMAQKFKEVSK